MATRNIVPRADGEGSLGTNLKKWGAVYTEDLSVTNAITGTASGNLPLTGGTMTGSITLNGNQAIKNAVTDDYIEFNGGTGEETGAHLSLYGKDHATKAGGFTLEANDGANSARMVGKPDGELTWDDKEVERVKASGTNYIRYESGLQMCWGSASGSGTSTATEVTYPQPFSSNPSVNATSGLNTTTTNDVNVQVGLINTTTFSFRYSIGGAYSNSKCHWIAIGFWK